MPETNDDETTPAAKPAPTQPAAPATAPNRGLVLSTLTLVVAVAALGVGLWALLSDSEESSEPAYTEEQSAEATTKTCEAFESVRRGVSINSNRAAPGGEEDVVGSLAVAANARLSLLGGGQYLLAVLDPATPEELQNQVREFGVTLMDIGAGSTAGVPTTDPAQSERMQRADEMSRSIAEACQ